MVMSNQDRVNWYVGAASNSAEGRAAEKFVAELRADQGFMRAVVAWISSASRLDSVLFTVNVGEGQGRDAIEISESPEGLAYYVDVRGPVEFVRQDEFLEDVASGWVRAMRAFAGAAGLGDPPALPGRVGGGAPSAGAAIALPVVNLDQVSAVTEAEMFEVLAPSSDPEVNLGHAIDALDVLPLEALRSIWLQLDLQLDLWFARLGAIRTDGTTLQALTLLLSGQEAWREALANPTKHCERFPLDPGRAEEVLVALAGGM